MSPSHAEAMRALAERAREAGRLIARAPTTSKDRALRAAADRLEADAPALLAANAADVADAQARGLRPALCDRLRLDAPRVSAMARALREVAAQEDLVGQVTGRWTRPNGLEVSQVRIPLGVVLLIYEARPNVGAEAGALCIKSGNACILRGGSEAARSHARIADCLRAALAEEGLPVDAVQIPVPSDHAAIDELLKLEELIDLVVPRGGEELVRRVVSQSRIPVIKHYKGVCHVYVDRTADAQRAVAIAVNAKAQRPGVCNAMETLLVHQDRADDLLPRLGGALQAAGVELRGCPRTCAVLASARPATEEDWAAEYLDLILAVRVVDSLEQAIAHIRRWGSRHTEAIVTEDAAAAEEFVQSLHSSVVLVNASTRFNDGGELGLGAEIGISTSPIHCFGPMGLEGLTTRRYVVRGAGQLRT